MLWKQSVTLTLLKSDVTKQIREQIMLRLKLYMYDIVSLGVASQYCLLECLPVHTATELYLSCPKYIYPS